MRKKYVRKVNVKQMNYRAKRNAFLLRSPGRFSLAGNVQLRPYQEIAIQAVVNSVRKMRGMSFVWIFPRQSGKDEALAILVQYLLTRCSRTRAGKWCSSTRPSSRKPRRACAGWKTGCDPTSLTIGKWKRRSGYIFQMNNAFCTYLSADPTAHVVSATANRLLVVNEAQDVGMLKYDKDIDPMAASTQCDQAIRRDTLDGQHAAGTGIPTGAGG